MKTLLSILTCCCCLWGNAATDTHVRVHRSFSEDSLICEFTTSEPNVQLSFLMQGVTIQFVADGDTVGITLPDASVVRNKVKRHPNEVKPTFRQDSVGEEIRPDLQPLITALCDTTALLVDGNGVKKPVRDFSIELNREERVLLLRTALPWAHSSTDSATVMIVSKAKQGMGGREFSGTRLSAEDRPNPNGLGEAPIAGEEQKRNVSLVYTVFIEGREGE